MTRPNLFTEAFFQDPYPVYREMQEQESAYWLEIPGDKHSGGAWMFTRYHDVKNILRNAHDTSVDIKQLVPESERNAFHYMLLYSDPPDHTRLRSLISSSFSKAAVHKLDDMILGVVDSRIDEMRQRREADFVESFAVPFPVDVITRILGTPFEDAGLLRDWTMVLTRGLDSTVADEAVMNRAGIALREMMQYFSELFSRPKQPGGSIIKSLASSTENGKCSAAEKMAQCMLLLLAGHETTVNLLSNGLYVLLSNPDELKKLRQNPELMESAVNEILRFEAPFQRATFRVTSSPMRFSSQEIRVGERISAVLSAANRDPDNSKNLTVLTLRANPTATCHSAWEYIDVSARNWPEAKHELPLPAYWSVSHSWNSQSQSLAGNRDHCSGPLKHSR